MVHKKVKSFDLLSAYNGYAPGWGGMFGLLGLLLLGSLIGSIIEAVLMLCVPGIGMAELMVVAYPVMFIPPMIYASARSRKAMFFDEEPAPLDAYKVEKGQISVLMLALMCAIGTIATAVITEPLVSLIPTEGPIMGPFYEYISSSLETMTGASLWIALLTTAVFAPFFEEWLCRGMVMRGLLQKTSPAVAIVVSATFFALIHMNPWQAIPAFILGCLFGIVYYKTGSLKLTMLMHCANNAFSVILSQIPILEGKDTFKELFANQTQYHIVYFCCLTLLALLISRVVKLRSTDNNPSTVSE